MSIIHSVTVYCSSSKKVAPEFYRAARDLGAAIANAGWSLVYGGNRVGCMADLADGARSAGAKVIGVTPQFFIDRGLADSKADELVVTESMRERKAIMEQRGDAFVAMPGGIGTYEEFFEILVGRQLGYHNKPIVLLNIGGFYDPMQEMMRHGLVAGFIRESTPGLYFVADQVSEAMDYLKGFKVEGPHSIEL